MRPEACQGYGTSLYEKKYLAVCALCKEFEEIGNHSLNVFKLILILEGVHNALLPLALQVLVHVIVWFWGRSWKLERFILSGNNSVKSWNH